MTRSPRDIEALYRRTYRAVLMRCRALVGNDSDARDLAQEVYLPFVENPDVCREGAELSYLFTVATHRAVSRLRARLRRSGGWEEAVTAILYETRPAGDPAARLEAKEELVKAFADVDETTTLIALYHFADGLSQGEVAKLVGLSRVTVNQRLQAFRRNL